MDRVLDIQLRRRLWTDCCFGIGYIRLWVKSDASDQGAVSTAADSSGMHEIDLYPVANSMELFNIISKTLTQGDFRFYQVRSCAFLCVQSSVSRLGTSASPSTAPTTSTRARRRTTPSSSTT